MDPNRVRLEDIRITSPCPTSWENMDGDDRIRFCRICSKSVYNLSAMTRVEAQLLLKETKGKICARFFLRKDGSIMAGDCPLGIREIRKRFAKRIGGVVTLVLSLFGGGALLDSHYGNGSRIGKIPSTQGQIASTTEDLYVLGGISDP